MPTRRIAIALAALISLSPAGCSGGGGPSYPGSSNPPPTGPQPGVSNPNAVTVRNNRFEPSTTSINVGTSVTWTWDACSDDGYGGTTCVDHSVTFDTGGPSSQTQSRGSFSRQFGTAGTFAYHCNVHSSMTGQIIVR